jgi:hypothetical protein
MLQPPPAEPGAPIGEIDTPALLLELDALERNVGCRGNRVECLWPVAARGGIA